MTESQEDQYSIELCLGKLDEDRTREVADFLHSEGALEDPQEADRRAAQTAALAYDGSGKLVGQLSAEARHVEQLHNRFWTVAVYINPQHRHFSLSRRMTRETRDFLEQRFLAGEDPDTIGLFMVLQTRAYKQQRNMAITPDGNIFIGRNRRGDNMRVYYFKGAMISGGPPEPEEPAPERYVLAPGYRVETVRDQLDELLENRIARFLMEEGAMDNPGQARQRAALTVVLAYDQEGNIVGQAAAEARYVRQLINQFWAFAVYVGKAHRQAHIARQLSIVGHEYLEQQFLAGKDPDVIGVYLRMRSPRLNEERRPAVSHYSKSIFFGRNRQGESLRVHYFPGARIDRGQLDVDAEN